jgi:serine/threonine-protein kinase
MGTVWAARNELTNRDFAIKFLKPTLVQNEEALARFFHEARACGQIRNPAIVDVLDVGHAEDGSPFLVMELLEGEGFDHRLARQRAMAPVDVCRWLAIVALGLDEAHARGLVHRDLKPGNIFFALTRAGEMVPKILDFGISKETASKSFEFVQTSSNSVLGSPAYMSPEQARGDLDIDARSDIWSLGVIMYESLTGQLPFTANNYNALMLAILNTPHAPVLLHAPECPPALAEVVEKCLVKERGKRMKSAAQLADELERVYVSLTGAPLPHPERSISISRTIQPRATQSAWSPDSVAPPGRRLRRSVGVGLAAAVVLGIVATAWLGGDEPTAPAAGRFGPIVGAVATRAQAEIDIARARAAASSGPVVTEVIDLDDAAPRGTGAAKARPAGSKGKATPGGPDPHGGVDSAGF